MRYLSLFVGALCLGGAFLHAEESDSETLSAVITHREQRTMPVAERFTKLFAPFRTENAALSTDGKYIAYSVREGQTLFVAVVPVDSPSEVKAKVQVVTDAQATPFFTDTAENRPGRILWMHWSSATRIVVQTNAYTVSRSQAFVGQEDSSGKILAFDFDGSNFKTLLTPIDLANAKSAARSFSILDFNPENSENILLRTAGNSRFEIYELNPANGKLYDRSTEVVDRTSTPLLDRQGHARVVVPDSTLVSFPHYYTLDKRTGWSRWTKLDKIAGFSAGNGFSVSPESYVSERAIPLGFDRDPDLLYFASNIGRNTFGVYSLNLTTGQKGHLAIENPAFDLIAPSLYSAYSSAHSLIYDRYTQNVVGIRFDAQMQTASWVDSDLESLQRRLEKTYPNSSVEIEEWDKNRDRFLVLTHGPADAGVFGVYSRSDDKFREIAHRAPELDTEEVQVTTEFAFTNPKGGGTISGLITLPRSVRMTPIPIVVYCANDIWIRTSSNYSATVHALADMGLAVVQINTRGTWGFGLEQSSAIKNGYEQAVVQDLGSALDYLQQKYPVLNPKYVAVFGEDRGGYLALRALQLDGQRYRCGIAIDPIVDIHGWLEDIRWTSTWSAPLLFKTLYGDDAHLKSAPLTSHPEQINTPICVFSYRGPLGAKPRQPYLDARYFSTRVKGENVPVDFRELSQDYAQARPNAQAQVLSQVEDFVNEYIYAYGVKMKDATPDKAEQ